MGRSSDLELMLNHPGWGVLKAELDEEVKLYEKKLRVCDEVDLGGIRGYLKGLEKVLEMPNIIINRG